DGEGVDYLVHRGGWLYHWLPMMLLKAHFVAEGRPIEDRSLDYAFNTRLRDRDTATPHYRRAVVIRPPSGAPQPSASDGGSVDDGNRDDLAQAVDALRAQTDDRAGLDVVVVTSDPGLRLPSRVRVLVDPSDDYVIGVSRAVDRISSQCVVFIDPGVEFGDSLI